MKSFRQLLRQPIKFIAGLILMTMVASIVCICVGQALAAQNTAKELDKQFTTVALAKGDGGMDANGYLRSVVQIPQEIRVWLEEMEQPDSDIVKTVANHGLLSASIPEINPLNYTQGGFIAEVYSEGNRTFYRYDPENDGRPYTGAMLVFTLEEETYPLELYSDGTSILSKSRTANDFDNVVSFDNWRFDENNEKQVAGYMVTLSGTITDVISMQEGFRDPTGMTLRLMLYQSLEEMLQGPMAQDGTYLEVGQSYLVYGMDYYDEDWALRSLWADERGKNIKVEAFDPSRLRYNVAEELCKRADWPDSDKVATYTTTTQSVQDADDGIPRTVTEFVTASEVKQMNTVSMTLYQNLRYISAEANEDMHLDSPYVDMRDHVEYVDKNGEEIVMTWEEYIKRYQIPTIARLEGSVEDFLQSEKGAPWREALERDAVNHHAFAVLGVDRAMYLAWFAQEEAKITQGRDITAEEAASGARVCIIHEAVALANGLEIGNTVTLNLYRGDNGLPYQGLRDNTGDMLMPSADFYFSTTPIQETAEYTVIGLWRGPDVWPDISLSEYSLSPNTVIVPKNSVQTAWEHPNSVLYASTVLHNGTIEEFKSLTRQAGYNHCFTYFDQGYTELVGNFHDYEMLAQQMLIVGMVVYAVILLLFLILFPGTQGKVVATMQSLGATRGRRFAHVMMSSLAITVPASVLGGGLGMALWQTVTDALQATAESTVDLQLEASIMFLIALAQFILAMAFTAIVAAWLTAPKSLAERRTK